jgi:hypothetical protein
MCNCTSEVWSFGASRNDGSWIVSRSLSSGARSRDPVARNDDTTACSNDDTGL